MEKSVNISQFERSKIQQSARELFLKTAEARHPDPTFKYNLAIGLFTSAYDECLPFKNSPYFKYGSFDSGYSFYNEIDTIKLPNDLFIYELNTQSHNLLNKSTRPFDIPESDYTFWQKLVPEDFKKGESCFIPFSEYGLCNLHISQEIINRIQEYNANMEDIYAELSQQLNALLSVIDECKTTKKFKAKLPHLVNLLPDSVVRKIQAKNQGIEKPISEEEELLLKATDVIATANMLSDN